MLPSERKESFSRKKKVYRLHLINDPAADVESAVSGLTQDWVEMHPWQNDFCKS